MQLRSEAMSDDSGNVASVSKRVKQTKREIEQLKNELQKLISVNLKADANREPTEEPPKPPEEKPSPALLTVETERDARRQSPVARSVANNARAGPKTARTRSKSKEPVSPKQVSPPKKRSYNVAEAREYIKKQRVKHAEQTKKSNTAANTLELKKQKLKELQVRTRELVAKNVEVKSKRLKSTERDEVQIDHGGNLRGMFTSKDAGVQRSSRSRTRDNAPLREKQGIQDLPKNVTVRQHLEPPVLPLPKKTFRPAELTEDLLNNDQLQRERLLETEHPVSKEGEVSTPKEKSPEESVEHFEELPVKHPNKKDTQTQTQDKAQTPIWLQSQHQSYPFNFINTVKKKLQFALNTPGNYVDVSTQIDASEVKSKSRAELKEIILKSPVKYQDLSYQSFASHKPPNLDLRTVDGLELVSKPSSRMRLFENERESESDTSKNIPDISSESENKALSLDKVLNLRLEPQSYSSDFVNTETEPSRRSSSKASKQVSSTLVTYEEDSKKTFQKSAAASRTSVISQSDIPETGFKTSATSLSASRTQVSEGFKTVTVSERPDESKTITEDPMSISEGSKTISEESMAISEIAPTTLSKTSNKQSSPDEVQSLKLPSVSLVLRNPSDGSKVNHMKNITVKRGEKSNNSTYEVHLKFEAEVHLLNDFNESLKQFMAVERAFEDIKSKDGGHVVATKVLQNIDTQTSVMTKTSTTSIISEQQDNSHLKPSINYSRGSEIMEKSSLLDNNNATVDCENMTNLLRGVDSTIGWDSEVSIKDDSQLVFSLSNIENYNVNNVAGLSYNMFDQLIKDEDRRIEHLRDIIKIREQALLDRTRTELVWLDVQRKQLLETGRIEEASLVKRKQRGVIVKHEQERNEMKKLDQMQKRASRERKIILKQQQSLIKSQLSTETMMSKIKVTASRTSKERRQSGPLRVVQSCSDSSFSKISSGGEGALNVSASQFMLGQQKDEHKVRDGRLSNMKKTLHMREAALQKRRKAAEELLRWHGKLLDEERKISELEAAASTVIKKGKTPQEERLKFKGKQLNGLWRTMSGREEKKFNDDKLYAMSQSTLEKFCKTAKSYKAKQHNSVEEESSPASAYSSAFETEESVESGRNSRISSISELMENLSKIEDEISMLSKKSNEDLLTLSEVKTQVSTSQIPTQVKKAASAKDSTSSDDISLSKDVSSSKELSSATDLSSNKSSASRTSTPQTSALNFSSAKNSIKSSSEQDVSSSTESSSKQISSVKELSSGPKTTEKDLTQLDSSKIKGDTSIKSLINNLSNLTSGLDPISVKDAASGKDSISIHDNYGIWKNPEESSDVIDKIQPIDLSELIEEVKSRIKEQESDFNSSSISEDVFSKISEAQTIASDATSINNKTDLSIEDKVNQPDSEQIPSSAISVSVPKETVSEIPEVLKTESSEGKIVSEKDLTSKISEGVESIGSDRIISGKAEDLTKSSSVKTEDLKSSRSEDSVKSLHVKPEDSVKTSSVKTEDSVKSSSLKSEEPVKSESNETGDSVKTSSVKTEDSNKSSSLKSEESAKSESNESGDSVKTSSLESEEPVKSESLKSEEPVKSKSNETDDSVKTSSVKTEDSVKSSSLKSEEFAKSESNESGDSVKTSIVKTEGSVKFSSLKFEEPVKSESLKSEEPVKSKSNETDDSVKTSSVKTEDSVKSSSLKSEEPVKFKSSETNDSVKSSSVKSEKDKVKSSSDEETRNINKSEVVTEPSARSESRSLSKKSEQVSIETEPSEEVKSKMIAEPSEKKVKSERESSIETEGPGARILSKEEIIKSEQSKSSNKIEENSNKKSQSESSISTETPHSSIGKTGTSESTDWKVIDKGKDAATAETSEDISEVSKNQITQDQHVIEGNSSSKKTDRTCETEGQSLKTGDQKSTKEDDVSKTTGSSKEKRSLNIKEQSLEKQDASTKKSKQSSGNGEEISEEISEDAESASTLHHLASDELSLDKSLEDKLSPEKSTTTSSDEKTPSPPSKKIDVKKRVSEILADATGLTRGADKSPRLQDLYVTAYDVPSLDLAGSPERLPPSILGHEAEELLKKQLAIEQEIKQLEQQQKAQASLVFMREIPNKPPPPYKPPVSMRPPTSVLPLQRKDIGDIASYSSKVLFKAHEGNKIDNAKFSENSFKLITNRYIDKSCCEFLFNICKELAKEHYKQFENVPRPSWMYLPNKAKGKPFDIDQLYRYFNVKLKEMFGFKTVKINESSIVQWGRKKRDHVDEILVEELLAQEADWTTFDKDELIVKDEVTNDIMKLLVEETADLLGAIMKKKGCLY